MARFVHQFVGSEYFTPSFNSAVFDGALRVYFAQSQESFALSFYQKIKSEIKWSFKSEALDFVLILIYPQEEWMQTNWAKNSSKSQGWALEQFDDDLVLAISADSRLSSQVENQIQAALQECISRPEEKRLAI